MRLCQAPASCSKMLKSLIYLCVYFSFSFLAESKLTIRTETVDGVIRAYAYKGTNQSENLYSCTLWYKQDYNSTGWDIFEVITTEGDSDRDQAYCAGSIEGSYTKEAIIYHYHNNLKNWCKGRAGTCAKIYKFLDEHLEWMNEQIIDLADSDPIWHQVDTYLQQIKGLADGYIWARTKKDPALNFTDFLVMNLQHDLNELAEALEGDVRAKARGNTRGSAIVKLLPNNRDLLVGHNTWTSYSHMYRMVKKYVMPVKQTGKKFHTVPGVNIIFSGYPGVITSGDDFYVVNYGLVAQETTIGNYNASRWKYVKPKGQLFESMRALIALRLADGGKKWCNIFSQYNSGTYNNQWMLVDYNKFQAGKPPNEGTLYILEQIPGYVRFEDQTSLLKSQTYWPSYNVPFYKDVFNMSGNQQLVDKYGNWFSYDKTPRALIFKRDHSTVTDLDSLLKLLRSNNYKNDPYSKCNCTPPYSAENAIAARSDLNPKNGHYPFPALGHRPHGAIDAKAISSQFVKNMTFLAVCGPTTGTNLTEFRWDKSGFKHLPHMGQPNKFTNFKPILTAWPN